jgi:O-antigen/teichoic acid export membrane protein
MLVSYVQVAFNTYWSAQMFQVVRGPGGDRVYVRICTYYSVTLIFVSLGVSLFSRPVLGLLVTPAFRGAAVFVPAIAVAYVVRSIGDHFRSVFFLENRTGKNAQVTIGGAIVCAGAYAVLIPWLKVWGAILATTIAFVFMGGLIFWEAQRVRRYEFEIRRLVQAAFCAGVCGLIGWTISVPQLWQQFLVAAACVCLFPASLFVTRFFDEAELGLLRRTIEALERRVSAPATESI